MELQLRIFCLLSSPRDVIFLTPVSILSVYYCCFLALKCLIRLHLRLLAKAIILLATKVRPRVCHYFTLPVTATELDRQFQAHLKDLVMTQPEGIVSEVQLHFKDLMVNFSR